jgi:hypothetical protein
LELNLVSTLPVGTRLVVDITDDLIGIQFDGEQEVALFIPNSGDVLRFSASDWIMLKQGHAVSELKATLQKLGALDY